MFAGGELQCPAAEGDGAAGGNRRGAVQPQLAAVDEGAAAVGVVAAERHNARRAAGDRQAPVPLMLAATAKVKFCAVQRGGAGWRIKIWRLALKASVLLAACKVPLPAKVIVLPAAEHGVGRDGQRAAINYGAAGVAVGRVGQGNETAAIGGVDALDKRAGCHKWVRK